MLGLFYIGIRKKALFPQLTQHERNALGINKTYTKKTIVKLFREFLPKAFIIAKIHVVNIIQSHFITQIN